MKYLVFALLTLSFNTFAADRPDCKAIFASNGDEVILKASSVENVYEAALNGHDFGAFIEQNSLVMIIHKPADANGDRESISSSQAAVKKGNANMYLSNTKEQITFLCRVKSI